jgi:hypothetical protein
MADDFRVQRPQEGWVSPGQAAGQMEVTIHCVACGRAYSERCDEARAQALLEMRQGFTCETCRQDGTRQPAPVLPQEADWERLIWSKLTGILFSQTDDGMHQACSCRLCGTYCLEAPPEGEATEAEQRRRLEFCFNKAAGDSRCPHWPRYLYLRGLPEVAAAVQTLAQALAEDDSPDPDAAPPAGLTSASEG